MAIYGHTSFLAEMLVFPYNEYYFCIINIDNNNEE